MNCEETKSTHVALVVLIAIDANDTITWLNIVHAYLTFTLRGSESCQLLRPATFVGSISQECQSLHIILTPGLDPDATDVGRQLSSLVYLDKVLGIGLSTSEQWRLCTVHVSQLDRVDTDANAGVKLRDYLLGKVALAEQIVILLCGELREFEVVAA